jgi:hypothetical protein
LNSPQPGKVAVHCAPRFSSFLRVAMRHIDSSEESENRRDLPDAEKARALRRANPDDTLSLLFTT